MSTDDAGIIWANVYQNHGNKTNEYSSELKWFIRKRKPVQQSRGSLISTWFIFNTSMDKLSHAQ